MRDMIAARQNAADADVAAETSSRVSLSPRDPDSR
jgi:hypothetical protein